MEFIKRAHIEGLLGKTLIRVSDMEKDSQDVYFYLDDGTIYHMFHEQDCCECVRLEDVAGNPQHLVGTPITKAEETTAQFNYNNVCSETYTFYLLATARGYVTLRWCGESNGYYSEAVDLEVLG